MWRGAWGRGRGGDRFCSVGANLRGECAHRAAARVGVAAAVEWVPDVGLHRLASTVQGAAYMVDGGGECADGGDGGVELDSVALAAGHLHLQRAGVTLLNVWATRARGPG